MLNFVNSENALEAEEEASERQRLEEAELQRRMNLIREKVKEKKQRCWKKN